MDSKKNNRFFIKMKPFVKWPGGKEKELKYFSEYFPEKIYNYIEPFVGGGAVFFHFLGKEVTGYRHINDFSAELISLYTYIKNADKSFYSELDSIANNISLMSEYAEDTADYFTDAFYKAIEGKDNSLEINRIIKKLYVGDSRLYTHLDLYDDVFEKEARKTIRIKIRKAIKLAVEGEELVADSFYDLHETSLKMALYNTVRYAYNSIKKNTPFKIAYFLYLREYCYSSMFRYNAYGEFNVPYGGMSYNNKNFMRTIKYIQSREMIDCLTRNTVINNLDFEEFIRKTKITKNDFIFCDPPYDTEFSEYEKNEFSRNDHVRLADCLKKTNARVMVVIKETDFIRKLYEDRGFFIETFDKKYNVNFQNRNNREVKHLIITNYEIRGGK